MDYGRKPEKTNRRSGKTCRSITEASRQDLNEDLKNKKRLHLNEIRVDMHLKWLQTYFLWSVNELNRRKLKRNTDLKYLKQQIRQHQVHQTVWTCTVCIHRKGTKDTFTERYLVFYGASRMYFSFTVSNTWCKSPQKIYLWIYCISLPKATSKKALWAYISIETTNTCLWHYIRRELFVLYRNYK